MATYGELDNAQYVTRLNQNVLLRTPDAAGFSTWVAVLDGGMSGLALIDGFVYSTEYRNRFLP